LLLTSNEIQLVVFDWAGTTIDHGSRAPIVPFIRAFATRGVEVTPDEARGPMGLPKKDHIRALLELPAIAERWLRHNEAAATQSDIAQLYERFERLQLEVVDDFTRLIPGTLECVQQLRQQGIRIGATTGYFRAAAERVYAAAAEQGYKPDCCQCADDVPQGRPAPWMIFRIMEALRVYPPSAVLKVGDTVPDIQEGLAAGVWSVGVLRSSSEVGCTEAEWERLPAEERAARVDSCREKLLGVGAHAVVETLNEIPALVAAINDSKGLYSAVTRHANELYGFDSEPPT
jgi:phosphonoacetaldehyde hydrolase